MSKEETVEIELNLPPVIERKITEEAERRGVAPDQVVTEALEREVSRRERMAAKANDKLKSGESRGNGTDYGYAVEIRDKMFSKDRPITLQDGIVGPDWRRVSFIEANNPAGVPIDRYRHGELPKHGLMPYASAVALAYTIIAQNHREDYRIECRIVQYKVETSYTVERMGVTEDEINGFVLRPKLRAEEKTIAD